MVSPDFQISEEQPTKETVYEVTYVSKDYDDDEEKIPSKSKDIYLVYYPPQRDRENTQPIIIAGAEVYKSANLYYLLVPAAMFGDLAVLTVKTWRVPVGGKCGPNVKAKKWPKEGGKENPMGILIYSFCQGLYLLRWPGHNHCIVECRQKNWNRHSDRDSHPSFVFGHYLPVFLHPFLAIGPPRPS